MVVDVITYNGEADLFDLRYNILKDYVDEFIVVEFDVTFSGKPKELLFKQLYPKVRYCFMPKESWMQYEDLAKASPNTEYGQGAKHWITEFCQKESIKDCLTHLKDEDIVYLGDCDEIYQPYKSSVGINKLKLIVYSYYLNNQSSEEFWGSLNARYGELKNKCLNHLRTNPDYKTTTLWGWHFTSLKDNLKQKLEASYTPDSYASEAVMQNLEQNIAANKDFLGREFKYQIDESAWPQYLKDNRTNYQHLLK